MKRKNLWLTLSLINLCIVALLGMTLRTKLLFPLPFLDFKNFLSAHSHFAFGGWVTLALMILYVDRTLPDDRKQKNVYQQILWGTEITSFGMLVSFPFQGYALFSIIFSTLFIFFTYGFCWVFINDITKVQLQPPVKLLSISALACLALSSIGPFTLAYILATKTGDAILYRDAIYLYLHFQYNGFFTLSVFALFFTQVLQTADQAVKKKMRQFAVLLCLSIMPALFLSLLWHAYNVYIRALAIAGCALTVVALGRFLTFAFTKKVLLTVVASRARLLLIFALVSFTVTMLLQIGTIVPPLANAVFGFRPIIIGFLHLVFLGFVSFYILSDFIEHRALLVTTKLGNAAIIFFAGAVILNEGILLGDGIGLLLSVTYPIYPWLLWFVSIFLFVGAAMLLGARMTTHRNLARA